MNIKFLKKLIIPILIFVFLFSPFIASAISFGDVVNAVKGMWINGVNYVMGIFVYLFATFAQIAGGLLDWVTSPGFISLPYTKAGSLADGGNPIIEAGLNITKNFVNMGLVVVLVFIALAVTLRIEEYATQKTLVRLIIIALLVNFAPIICGLIVDASNIIMNYFLVGIREGISGILIDNSTAGLTGTLTRPGSVTTFSLLAKGAVMIILNLFIGLAFLLLASVFVFRYIAIWILVILSPLAFIAWILPATKRLWEMWWKQLLNWSFIGIPMAFFLYLAMSSVAGLNTYFQTQITASGLEPETTGLLNNVFPYFAVLGILFFGFFIGISASAMGSSAVVNFAKARGGQVRTSAGWMGRKAWQGAALADRKFVPKVGAKDEEGKRHMLRFTTPRGVSESITTAWDKTPGLRWFRPEPLKQFSEFRGALEANKKSITGPSNLEMDRVANGKYTGKKAAAAVDAIIRDRGDSQDFVKAYMRKYGYKEGEESQLFKDKRFLNDKTAIGAFEFIKKTGNMGKILRIDPRLAKIGRSEEEGRKKMIESLINAKPGDIANMEREVIDNEEIMETAMAVCGEEQLRAFGRLKGGTMARQDTVNNIVSKWVEGKGLDPAKEKENWEAYMNTLKEKYNVSTPGIQKSLENPRFRSLGWEEYAKYRSKEQRATPSGVAPPTPSPTPSQAGPKSPGSAAMGEPPAPKGRRPGGGQTGGEQRKPKGRKPEGH
ncbi:MAG: hypothetical protein A2V72_02930 [Candidatus Nealsonbacteria bacterium RBG_13_37_56]|uniref:Uncharacterized protein n=1 Tax=Candidatus Nealsonbacteria bacterium RBG_13_37_56 TaxID=1801661 RepID=A0A1G2DW84_9BACT|nr:MAG: hypothetical protein A2V72_02930 [Candidatus Nealsonbacteria bacterium RBG_13_37_56]